MKTAFPRRWPSVMVIAFTSAMQCACAAAKPVRSPAGPDQTMDIFKGMCHAEQSDAPTLEATFAQLPSVVWEDRVGPRGERGRVPHLAQSVFKYAVTNHDDCDHRNENAPVEGCHNPWQINPKFDLILDPGQTVTLGQLSVALGRPKLFRNAGPHPRDYLLAVVSGAKKDCIAHMVIVPAGTNEAEATVKRAELYLANERLDPSWAPSRCVVGTKEREPATTCGAIDPRVRKRFEALCERLEGPRPVEGAAERIRLSDPLLGHGDVRWELGRAVFRLVEAAESDEDRRLAQLPGDASNNIARFTREGQSPLTAGEVLQQLGPACTSDPEDAASRKLYYYVLPSSTGVSCTLSFPFAPAAGDLRRSAVRGVTLEVGVYPPILGCYSASEVVVPH